MTRSNSDLFNNTTKNTVTTITPNEHI